MTHFPNKTIQDVYLKMLEYGNECFHCGITFPEIKQRLISDGLFSIDQPDETLQELFLLSYIDNDSTCIDPNKDRDDCGCNTIYFDHLNLCNHCLSKQGCLDLVTLSDAILNKQAAADNLKSTKTANKIAYIALTVAIIGLIYNPIKDIWFTDNPTKSLQSIQKSIDTIHTPVFAVASKYLHELDSVHTNRNQKNSIFSLDSLNNISHKKNIYLTKGR